MIQDLSGSWCIKGSDESTLVMDSSVPLMDYDPSDLGSLIMILIQITPEKRTLSLFFCIAEVRYKVIRQEVNHL